MESPEIGTLEILCHARPSVENAVKEKINVRGGCAFKSIRIGFSGNVSVREETHEFS
jgi:hypothetical protein